MTSELVQLLSTPEAAGVAIVMVVAGLRTNALERRPIRRCPGCGRDIRVCHCC